MKVKLIIGIFLSALMLGGCALLPKEEEGKVLPLVKDEEAVSYNVETVLRRDVEFKTNIYAEYTFLGGEQYSFKNSGRVSRVYVKAGDYVSVGDELAIMSSYSSYVSQVDEYSKSIANKESKLSKYKEERDLKNDELSIRFKYGDITKEEYVKGSREVSDTYDDEILALEDEISILKLKMDTAKKEADKSIIISKTSGVVSYCMTVSGNGTRVDAGEIVVAVGQAGDRGFVCEETDYPELLKVGDTLTMSTSSGTVYSVIVREIDGKTIFFDLEYSDATLSTGLRISTSLVVDSKKDVISISKTSLHSYSGGNYVYVLDENGIKTMRNVTVGLSGNIYVEITQGLSEGDQIVK